MKNLFNTRKSVASIMAGFTKQIEELNTLSVECQQQEAEILEQISIAEANLTAVTEEGLLAHRAAKKLKEFIEV